MATAVDRAKQVTMTELNAIIGVSVAARAVSSAGHVISSFLLVPELEVTYSIVSIASSRDGPPKIQVLPTVISTECFWHETAAVVF